MSEKRIEKWDIARGVLIFIVVLGHVVDYYTANSRLFAAIFFLIYSFHMPCFLFLDGLFGKRTINEKRYHKIFSYLILYLVAKFMIAITRCVVGDVGGVEFDLLSANGLPWYGLALFLISLATVFLKDFPKRWTLIFSVVLACFVGYDSTISDYLALSRTIVYFPFFFLGYCINPEDLMARINRLHIRVASFVCLVAYAAFVVLNIDSVYKLRTLLTGRNPFATTAKICDLTEYLQYFGLIRLAYYFVVFLLCMCFLSLMPSRLPKFTMVSTWGKRSLQIYLLHRCILYFLYSGKLGEELLKMDRFGSTLNFAAAAFLGAVAITFVAGLPVWEKPIRRIIYPKIGE